MGKSSKRKNTFSSHNQQQALLASGTPYLPVRANELAASVYAKTSDIAKDDITYLKSHMKLNSAAPRVRLKSNAPKRLNSLMQGVLSEFAQPNHNPYFQPLQQQPFDHMQRQLEAVQQAQVYIQQKKGKKKKKRAQMGDTHTQSSQNDYHEQQFGEVMLNQDLMDNEEMIEQENEEGSPLRQEQSQENINAYPVLATEDDSEGETVPRDLQELQRVSQSMHENASQDRRVSSLMMMEHKNNNASVLSQMRSREQEQQFISQSSAIEAQQVKKQTAPGSMRKANKIFNLHPQMQTPISKMSFAPREPKTALPLLTSVEKSLHMALTAYGRMPLIQGITPTAQMTLGHGQLNTSKAGNNHLQSPREAQRSSLVLQRVGLKTSNKLDFQQNLNGFNDQPSHQTLTVHSNSKKNLFSEKNDSSYSKLPKSAAPKFPFGALPQKSTQQQVLLVSQDSQKQQRLPVSSPRRLMTQQRPSPFARTIINGQNQNDKTANMQKRLISDQQTPPPQEEIHHDVQQPKDTDQSDDDLSEECNQVDLYCRNNMVESIIEENEYQETEMKIGSSPNKGCVTQRDTTHNQELESALIEGRQTQHQLQYSDIEQQKFFGIPPTNLNAQLTSTNFNNQQKVANNGSFGTAVKSKQQIKRDKERERQKELEREKEREAEKEKERLKSGELIFCQVVSTEPYMKRCMNKLGWFIVPGGMGYHIRFDISDKEGTHNKLLPRQWYNHFPSNRELTTKAGLCKNLWHQCFLDYELQVPTFFPRCYDLSDQKHIDQFINDFQTTAILSIIKQYSNHFRQTNPKIDELLAEYLNKDSFESNKIYKQNFRLKCSQIDLRVSGAGSLLGNDMLRFAMVYIRQNIIKKYHIDANHIQKRFTEDEIQMMIDFSQQLWEIGLKNEKFPIYEQIKTLALDRKLRMIMPQYNRIDGVANVWVVKPSFNARGVGVYCTNKMKDIIQPGKKCGSKVVQKYIESPFLINNKKFDIRQWVLVTSWEPLDVYVFSSAYLKICGNDFNLRNLSDQYSHLSNFSIQKVNKQFCNDELVMSNQQFEDYVRKTLPNKSDYSWDKHMRPQINQVVFATLKGVQESMDQRPNTFEIYGFDLILDNDLRPWVIEVNLSPACNERTDWLTKMVDDMCLDLLTYLEQRIAQQSENDPDPEFKDRPKRVNVLPHVHSLTLNKEQFYLTNDIHHRWIRLDESLTEFKNTKISEILISLANPQQNQQITQQLQIIGIKLNNKYEKNIDKDYKKQISALIIQKIYRGYKDRKLFKYLIEQKSSLIIQRQLRRRLAVKSVKQKIKNISSICIQSYLRKQFALQRVKEIINQKINQAQLFVAIKLQSHFRRHKAKQTYTKLFLDKKACLIQTYLRSKLSRKEVSKKLSFKAKIVRIQRFWKRWLKFKSKKAIIIQKRLRQVRGRKKVRKLLSIKIGSEKLQKIYTTIKQRIILSILFKEVMAVKIQKHLRQKLAIRKIKEIQKSRNQEKLQRMFYKYKLHLIKELSKEFRTLINSKVSDIQRVLRGFKARKIVRDLRILKLQNEQAIVIQCRLRQFLANREIEQRQVFFYALIKVQSFVRMVLAKRYARLLRFEKEQIESKKQKKLEKKISRKQSAKKNKPNKEIENFIENLLQKDLDSQRRSYQLSQSQTPAAQRRSYQELPPFVQNSLRGSLQAVAQQQELQEAHQRNGNFDSTINVSDYGKNQNSAHLPELQNGVTLSSSICQRYVPLQHPHTAIDDQFQRGDESVLLDRLQRSLRVRKHHNAKTIGAVNESGKKSVTALMNNYSDSNSKKISYQRELNNKVISAIQKAKSNGQAPSQQSQRIAATSQAKKQQKLQELPKPKTFAENLMSMLAKQNIGQAFSENPVEALQVLKEVKAPAASFNYSQGNKSNIWIDQSISNPQRRNSQQVPRQENTAAGTTNSGNFMQQNPSQQSTIEGQSSKFTSFPKLADFKSATNNIYLQNRPIADPRKEAEYQQDILDQRLKQSKLGILPLSNSNNVSRSDIHRGPEVNQTRKSIENVKNFMPIDRNINQSISPNMPSGISAIEDNMMLQRPQNKETNLVVIQAYKKQLNNDNHGGGGNFKKQKSKSKKDHYSKSKRKFMKMVEMDEGILFPLTNQNHSNQDYSLPQQKKNTRLQPQQMQQQPSIASSGYNSLSYENGGGGKSTLQQNQSASGGATTMPPIFVETKLMIV